MVFQREDLNDPLELAQSGIYNPVGVTRRGKSVE